MQPENQAKGNHGQNPTPDPRNHTDNPSASTTNDQINKCTEKPLVERASEMCQKVLEFLPEPFAWCVIEAGSVDIEDASDASKRYGSEGGLFHVAAFLMAKYPITNAQFAVFEGAHDGYQQAEWWDLSLHAQQWRKRYSTPGVSAYEGADLPRTNIAWYDAMAFSRWMSERVGINIRLPSESQWQRAAKGDSDWTYPWGNQIDQTRCNYGGNVGQPTPVTRYENGVSPYGVYDMAGNVWEWTITDWTSGRDDAIVLGAEDGFRVLRGGSWFFSSQFARSDARVRDDIPLKEELLGFRVCALGA